MSIFPFLDGDIQIENSLQSNELSIPKEYAWDFENNDFILKDGRFVIVEGLEAIKIWIYKTLKIQRYRYLAYSWNYGHELENLIGSTFTKQAIQSEAKRYLEEALLINPYIKAIKDLKAEIVGDALKLDFTVATDYGEVSINV